MRTMDTMQDLIEEAKLRTVWWGLFIFAVAYFLTNTSKSMLMNVPIAVLMVSALRILTKNVEFWWKPRSESRPRTYLSHLMNKQLPLDDPRLSTSLPPPKWKMKIDSPVVEAAMDEFIGKILQDFVVDLWYAEITPDKEVPELIRRVIMEALGEISGRVRQLNLVELLTSDMIDLIGDHIEIFRRNQAVIGADVMGILSSEERDERLKYHLMVSKELHPALISPECEYKVLQRLIEGVLAIVLGPQEAQCPLVKCIARELVTCLVLKPVMDFASPVFVNEVIEQVILAMKDDWTKETGDSATNIGAHHHDYSRSSRGVQDAKSVSRNSSSVSDLETSTSFDGFPRKYPYTPPADWVRVMEAATQRRTEVLTPENLENMWARGRHYNPKVPKSSRPKVKSSAPSVSDANCFPSTKDSGKDLVGSRWESSKAEVDEGMLRLSPLVGTDALSSSEFADGPMACNDPNKNKSADVVDHVSELESRNVDTTRDNNSRMEQSKGASTSRVEGDRGSSSFGGLVISEDFYSYNVAKSDRRSMASSTMGSFPNKEAMCVSRLRCRVVGASFEKNGSNSVAVYSIAVSNEENVTWQVKRRYSNFERLHRLLKEFPNYTLHLPPKRIFSSSTEDTLVHQRCIQLSRYLQDLLSIANVAEQPEVRDFLSVSSKNYSIGKSLSVMKTLAVNVDEAMDDIVRQFKGVSDGLMRKVVGSPSPQESLPSTSAMTMPWSYDDTDKPDPRLEATSSTNSLSENGEELLEPVEEESTAEAKVWSSENETHMGSPYLARRQNEELEGYSPNQKPGSDVKMDWAPPDRLLSSSSTVTSEHFEDPVGMPQEWTPPNVSVPVLNLVDKIFQLKRRGWLRRQVFWISKQIVQLMMEDAIDDWLLRQVHWLRREDVVAQGIRWIQDILWPGGTFFRPLAITQSKVNGSGSHQNTYRAAASSTNNASQTGSFMQHLEETRRANEVKKILLERAPTTLVSLIGQNQYRRCAKDLYYFSQSTICMKQLAYGALQLLVISVFPELREVIFDIHKEMRGKPLV